MQHAQKIDEVRPRGFRVMHVYRQTETDRQTDRQTGRQINRQTTDILITIPRNPAGQSEYRLDAERLTHAGRFWLLARVAYVEQSALACHLIHPHYWSEE